MKYIVVKKAWVIWKCAFISRRFSPFFEISVWKYKVHWIVVDTVSLKILQHLSITTLYVLGKCVSAPIDSKGLCNCIANSSYTL